MNSEQLYDAITDVKDELVREAAAPRRRKKWPALAAAGLAAMLAVGILLPPEAAPISGGSAKALAVAEYPEMLPYPEEANFVDEKGNFDDDAFYEAYKRWAESEREQYTYLEKCADAPDAFLRASLGAVLGGSDGKNRIYSPLNVYMALGMLAETVDGESRTQILDLLDCPDMETLRRDARALWNTHYRSGNATTSILAASLWLNEDMTFRQETLNNLASTYYASSYQGTMGSEEMNEALRTWLNDQTGGLLEAQTADIALDPQTVMALATTIYFRAKWGDEFNERATDTGVFHGAAGDTECEFMHRSWSRSYYWAENFSAVGERLRNGGEMWFLLPDEGVSVEAVLPGAAEFFLQGHDWENRSYLMVNMSLPKFDVSSQLDLKEALQSLGVTDVFESGKGDFSPLSEDAGGIYVSKVQHDARVAIDEEGVTAAAYTVIPEAGAGAPPKEEVDFIVDRPFLFAITGSGGHVLFAGVVNQV